MDEKFLGLSTDEALKRQIKIKNSSHYFKALLKIASTNFISALNLLLFSTAIISIFFGDLINAVLIFIVVFVSSFLSFIQEKKAYDESLKMIEALKIKQTVYRDGQKVELNAEDLVMGDLIDLEPGDLIPLDCVLIESKDLFIDESNLTGESIPKEKSELSDKEIKMGSCVVSGFAKAIIIPQKKENSFQSLMDFISKSPKNSSFAKSLKGFSSFLLKATLIFVGTIFILLYILKKDPFEAFLFALAIAVGLSPQLLPAILSTNLSIGSQKMAQAGALTKRLESIENFGNIDLLCCDKTGTITKGHVEMYASLDKEGLESSYVKTISFLNAKLQSGIPNSLDKAILLSNHFDTQEYEKLDEIPYDFSRKRISVLLKTKSENLLITKGALENILGCSKIPKEEKAILEDRAMTFYNQGLRVLGIATKNLSSNILSAQDESNLEFQGFLLFLDPLKEDTQASLTQLKDLGIRVVMITGDHPRIAEFTAEKAGFLRPKAICHSDIASMDEEKLMNTLRHTDVFAQMEPMDKLAVIEAFKKMGHTVGFLGDGINDSAAIFASDVGISVESGTELTKATSDFILTKKNLSILAEAVKEGRKVFSNTLKYILMAVSANFGNMFSMAGISLSIPFLPLLPTQILLVNLLQDIPEMAIASDKVDPHRILKPQKWDIKFIRNFMLVFGPISSLFDFATFFLLFKLNASVDLFRTGWFTESVLSATFIVLFVRTKYPFFKSRPSKLLTFSVFTIIGITLLIPYTGIGTYFKLYPMPKAYYIGIFMIVLLYAAVVEIAKKIFYRKIQNGDLSKKTL
jgi:Mg2+-importing ATPase